ncbi:MAG: type II toxin-antitoxin system Phd/YefM family antitoxin [Alphaproteobacteria bacterium]|nr:type II toxin-antitoxin system Phd/YefM family antitoxin [Alphaproteobacteria bacterium]
MAARWALQDAKAKFSQVVKAAAADGPQLVTLRGAETAVVLSIADYRRLEAQRPTLVDYLLAGPKLDDRRAAALARRARDKGRRIAW